MVVTYPLTAQNDYTELKYSLRSLQKFLPPPFEVVIVGDHVPEWINNVTVIQLPDIKGQRELSVRRKVLAALEYAKEILFMNDDFYLLREYTPVYYTSGVLNKVGESGAKSLLNQLQKFNKPVKYYGHYPVVYKKDFREAMENFTPDCLNKSAYCNFIEAQSVEVQDCKLLSAVKPGVIEQFIKGKPCFSTGVNSINSAVPVLQELFSEPSKYEI